jgi:choice-of-anchor A domain-containing protein
VSGSSFSGGFAGQSVSIDLPNWQGGTSLAIKAVARSLNPNALSDSAVVSGVLTVSPMSLRAPVITAHSSSDMVTIQPDSGYGDTPVGHRIIYTLDGSEPAEGHGSLYSGPINVPRELFVHTDLKARVFPPPDYSQWFYASPVSTLRKHSKATTSAGYAFLQDYHNAGMCAYTCNVFGTFSNVAGSGATITGSIAVGPLAMLDFDHTSNFAGYVHNDPLGIVTGTTRVVTKNIAPIRDAAMQLNAAASQLIPTQTYGSITGTTKIDAGASDGMNIISIQRIKLASADTLTFRGGPSDFFIVNVTESVELTGSSLIKTSGSMRPDRVLINVPNGGNVKLTGGAGIMSITFMAPRSSVTIGGNSTYTGNIFSGNFSGLNGTPQLIGGDHFGECDDCCD